MKLSKRLISYLHRVFDKDPAPFLAVRLACDGTGLTWSISDAVLHTLPVDGTAAPLSVDLTAYTVTTLAAYLSSQPGYSVLYVDVSQLAVLGAAVLMDGSGDINQSNGDHLYGYTNVLWSYMEANAVELRAAETQIGNMLVQMSTTTAEDVWLDELGGYYNVSRNQGELDAQYGPRIIAQVLRPLANNVAIENALRVINNNLPVTVDDYDTIVNNSYGQFDVSMTVSLDFLAVTAYVTLLASIISTISKMRDAGTFLRRIAILTGVHADYYAASAVICGETVIVYPELTPSLVYDFRAEGRTYPGLTCTRAGASTRWNSSAVLESVSANALRISRDPVSGNLGLLVEEARANAIRNNMMVGSNGTGLLPNNWAYQTSGVGVDFSTIVFGVEDGITYIDVTFTRDVGSTGGSVSFYLDAYNTQPASQAQIWTASVYIRKTSGTMSGETCQISCIGRSSSGSQTNAGSTTVAPTNAAMKTQRISRSLTLASFSTAYVQAGFSLIIPAGGAATSVIRIGLPQLELGAFATTPILTSGTSVTRAADVVSAPLGSWFNASEGVLNAWGSVNTPSGGSRRLAQLGSGADSMMVGLASTTSADFLVTASSVTQADSPVTVTSSAAVNKVAGAYKANDFIAVANGALGTADTSGTVPSVGAQLHLGSNGGADQFTCGHIHRVEYYGRRLTNAQMQFLTT